METKPKASRMLSGRETTTACALTDIPATPMVAINECVTISALLERLAPYPLLRARTHEADTSNRYNYAREHQWPMTVIATGHMA